jgi:hypothetical protein
MKKTIANALMVLGFIGGLGAATDIVEQEQRDFRELFGPRAPQSEVVASAPSQNAQFHIGTAVELAVSGSLLGGAFVVNSRASKATRLDVERVFMPQLNQIGSSDVVDAFNRSKRGFEKLISYLSSELKIQEGSTEQVSAAHKSDQVMVVVRVVVDGDDAGKVEMLFEAIAELIEEKVDQAQHIMLESRMGFEDSFAEAVEDEVKMGKQMLIKTLKSFKMRRSG